MIPRETVDKIIDSARIEEVVGDFVTLKKRGANLLGLCPFHNEKTPSFTVSPVKGIYKCFGCGKAGNAVNFMMDHDHLTYPEALRYLAQKYNIVIEDKEQSPEQLNEQNERESLYLVTNFACSTFSTNLLNSDEGKSIALSYFRARGFTDATIQKFQLGYALENRHSFTQLALSKGYKLEYLVKAGLTIDQGEQSFDRFASRVMFPIHNVTGRVIAFGGRTLKTDKKTAKYINSPETSIYHKSNVLYGMFFAKKTIIEQDNCFLAEGYTDVISMHQAGIENVVASSGTSLTIEQIRLIKRYTKNITILYDGDSAGIKASFRGIDLILEEGLNVKVLLFPDGDDPDSFSKKHNHEALKQFIAANTRSFVEYKTELLMQEAGADPFKKSSVVREIAATIALLDALDAGEYIRKFVHNRTIDIDEQLFHNEVNKQRRDHLSRKKDIKPTYSESIPGNDDSMSQTAPSAPSEELPEAHPSPLILRNANAVAQEQNIIRLLLNYGDKSIELESKDDEGQPITNNVKVAEVIVHELSTDNAAFEDSRYQFIYKTYCDSIETGVLPDLNTFINKENIEISKVVIDFISSPYTLAKWDKRQIIVQTEEMILKDSVYRSIFSYKAAQIEKLLAENGVKIESATTEEDQVFLIVEKKKLIEAKKEFNKLLGRIIIK